MHGVRKKINVVHLFSLQTLVLHSLSLFFEGNAQSNYVSLELALAFPRAKVTPAKRDRRL